MRSALPLLTGAALLLGGCHLLAHEHRSGPQVTRNYQVGAFDKLAVAGDYDVDVRTGSAPSVHAEGGQSRLDKMEVKLEGDTLHIQPDSGSSWSWSDGGKVKLIITVPALSGAAIAGSGNISVDGVNGPAFNGEVAGSGDLKLAQVNARHLSLKVAGSGSATATGKANDATYEIAGSGDIDAANLQAQTAAVSISGSGGVHAHATNAAAIEMMGSGGVTITGGAKCTISKAGSGNIRCS